MPRKSSQYGSVLLRGGLDVVKASFLIEKQMRIFCSILLSAKLSVHSARLQGAGVDAGGAFESLRWQGMGGLLE